jgi:PEP-CTERM motif-containing protein
MRRELHTRPVRVMALVTLFCALSALNLRAEPIVVTSGILQTFDEEPPFFQFFGADGFVLAGTFPLLRTFPDLTCPLAGCAPGTTANMTVVVGGPSAATPFTLGVASGAVINGTVFVRPFGIPADAPRLAGTLRFDAPTVAVNGFNAAPVPFVFSGEVSGFAADDTDLRAPLFQVTLTGHGTAHLGFEDDFRCCTESSLLRYTFDAAPAATPEPTTLALFGTGVVGVMLRARKTRKAGGL